MGIGYQGLQFSLFAKNKGVDFQSTLMIGRQNHYLNAETLRGLFLRFALPLVDADIHSILEGEYAEGLFRHLGASLVDSLDASDYEGANILHDMNHAVTEAMHEKYSCVTDFGSLEHVFNFPCALKNAIDMVKTGGHFLSVTTANNLMGHGFYQFSPELFFNYLEENGFVEIEVHMLLYRNMPYFFRARNPKALGSRVELVNNEPVMMGVLARKAERKAKATFPIQSDYQNTFWKKQDVDRTERPVPVDPKLAASLLDFKSRMTALASWPESISPHFVNGFENYRLYQLIDPADDKKDTSALSGMGAVLHNINRVIDDLARDNGVKVVSRVQQAVDRLRSLTSAASLEYAENHGVLIPIVPGVFSDQIASAVRRGDYETSEASELDSLIQPEEVILEIGAGCGFISTYCAKNPHTKAVHCVEANPALIEVIRLTHEINRVDNVQVYHEVLAKEEGETDFYVHEDFWASGTHDFLGKPLKVKTTPFQRRLEEIRPTMLIVDIEGGEATLFEGMDLTGVKKILLEVHQPTIGRRGMKRLFDCLSEQDFHYDMWHSCRSIVTFSHIDRG